MRCQITWLLLLGAPVALGEPQTPPAIASPEAIAQQASEASKISPEQAGYQLGLAHSEQLYSLGISDSVEHRAFDRGLRDGLQGKRPTPAERQGIQSYIHLAEAAQRERNAKQAKEFLDTNVSAPGVTVTPSGLQYKVLQPGDPQGRSPELNDVIVMKYSGRLIDGTEFYNSWTRGVPTTLMLSTALAGWKEGIALMKPGAKYEFFVPPELGYGPNPHGRRVPGNSLLICDIELVSARSAQESAPGAGRRLPGPPLLPPPSH